MANILTVTDFLVSGRKKLSGILFFQFFLLFQALGWSISALGLIQLPLWMIYAICQQKDENWLMVSRIEIKSQYKYLKQLWRIETILSFHSFRK